MANVKKRANKVNKLETARKAQIKGKVKIMTDNMKDTKIPQGKSKGVANKMQNKKNRLMKPMEGE